MKIGVIYLGQMDSSVCCLLMSARHQYVVFDINDEPLASLSKQGAKAVGSLAKVVSALQEKPRAIWVMLPAGEATEETVGRLSNLLEPHDIIVDDGSSYYKDDIRHAKRLGEKGIRYVDQCTSGVWGLDRDYCMMIGGPREAVDHLDSIFAALAAGVRAGHTYTHSVRSLAALRHWRPAGRRRALRRSGLAVPLAADALPASTLIKGLGGALLREKIVAAASARMIVVVDESKLVDRLASHVSLPVAIVRFGWQTALDRLTAAGVSPKLRKTGSNPFVTDDGHQVADRIVPDISDPAALERRLATLIGVVQSGLFVGLASKAIVSGACGVAILEKGY